MDVLNKNAFQDCPLSDCICWEGGVSQGECLPGGICIGGCLPSGYMWQTPPCGQNDRQVWKPYLPGTSFEDGKNQNFKVLTHSIEVVSFLCVV